MRDRLGAPGAWEDRAVERGGAGACAAAAAAGAVRDWGPLARQLLSGEIRDGDTVRVDLDAAADRLTVPATDPKCHMAPCGSQLAP